MESIREYQFLMHQFIWYSIHIASVQETIISCIQGKPEMLSSGEVEV